ncbi:MAG: hypothetical protein RLZZ214_1750 [Verrucomicrobiota bacterium]
MESGIADLSIGYYHPFMTTISLKIPDELLARMDAVASAKRTSRSALLREALEEKLEVVASKSSPSLYDRSADLCGKDHSGVGDLASNPKHLEGFGS